MSELYTLDNPKRKDAERATRDGISVAPRKPPPKPNLTLEQAEDFSDLADKLEASADRFAQLAAQASAAERDGDMGPSDEVNYGLLETDRRNIAEAIREILSHG